MMNLLAYNTFDDINEEELKNKVILPYVSKLGFAIEEISFEKSFTLKFGRGTYRVDSNIMVDQGRARFDILCKKSGRNLFLIEVKRPSVDLTIDEIDQAISYSRLLEQIPPFTIITNGVKTLIYDSITKKETTNLDATFDFDNYIPALEEDLRIRCEALRNFIGYSYENLKIFNQIQRSNRMQTLKGNRDNLTKKYIPELYVPRKRLMKDFETFIQSESICLALIGESGIGKTNLVCALAENDMNNCLSLFYNAPDLSNGIWGAIKDDFNWQFSAEQSEIEIIRILEGLLPANYNCCIFIDAIDEGAGNLGLELDDFIRRVKGKKFKLVITCKDTEWDRFLTRLGNPTILSENVYKPSIEAISNEQQKESVPGTRLSGFDNDELLNAETKYKSIFNFSGDLSHDAKEECKHPFMLRIVGEVYQDSSEERINDVSSIEILTRFLSRKLEKMDAEIARRILSEIGKIFIDEEVYTNPENTFGYHINEDLIRNKLNIPLHVDLYPPLFTHRILVKTSDSLNRKYIEFYYTTIRDFIISIYSLRMDKLSNKEFENIVQMLDKTKVGKSVLNWYYYRANSEHHREIMDKFIASKVTEFVTSYQGILDNHFYTIKDKFPPYTVGRIGMVIDINNGITDYAFRRINPEDDLVLPVPNLWERWESNYESLSSLGIFSRLRRGYRTFSFTSDPKEEAFKDIQNRLKELVKNGQLDESVNIGINLEKLLVILRYKGSSLDLAERVHGRLSYEQILPVRLDKVEKLIKLGYARFYYEKELGDEKIRNSSSTAISWTPADYKKIQEQAEEAVREGKTFPRPNIGGDVIPWKALEDSVNILNQAYAEIDDCLLPRPDLPVNDDCYYVNEHRYSDLQLQMFIKKFYEIFISEYEKLVSLNFPTIMHKFNLYSKLPVHVVIEIDKLEKPIGYFKFDKGYNYAIIPHQPNNVIEVHLNTDGNNPRIIYDSNLKMHVVKSNVSNIEITKDSLGDSEIGGGLMSNFFGFNNFTVPIQPNIRLQSANQETIVRNCIYNKIHKELEDILKSGLEKILREDN